MDITALFPSPVATFFDFITEEERLQIFESIMSVEHPPHGAITGKVFLHIPRQCKKMFVLLL